MDKIRWTCMLSIARIHEVERTVNMEMFRTDRACLFKEWYLSKPLHPP